MKIFDFTNGVKGELLGESRLPDSQGCARMVEGTNDEYSPFEVSGMTFHESAHLINNDEILPEDYKVDAICFCTGQVQDGTWCWSFLATTEWLKENGYLDGFYLRRDKELV